MLRLRVNIKQLSIVVGAAFLVLTLWHQGYSSPGYYAKMNRMAAWANNRPGVRIRKSWPVFTPRPSKGQEHIPLILHQTWDSVKVPGLFAGMISSWAGNHSNWQYWFWTPADGRLLIKKFFPEYLAYYDKLNSRIFQVDVMRYFVMYKYGGLFVDLDTENLKPMDPWTKNHSCVLSENNYVHSMLLKGLNYSEATLGTVLSRPGHPFFSHALNMLPKYWDLFFGEKRLFVDKVYRDYITTSVSSEPGNKVTLTHPKYFLPTFDPQWGPKVEQLCEVTNLPKLKEHQQDMCLQVKKQYLWYRPQQESYVNHYWGNLISKSEEWKQKDMVNIHEIVPRAKNVTQILLEK